jgi:serine/threonine-protein kinase RsbW
MSPADGRADRSTGRSGSNAKRGARPAAADAAGAAHPAAPVPGTPFTQMTIPSDYNGAREVQRLIREEVEQAGYDPDSQFAIKLALEEALINAIKHGNKLDKDKSVRIEWRVTRDATEISIEDEGPGFDRKSVPDPTDVANLEKLTGRGILLIEAYMTSVRYSNGGRRVHLLKQNTPAPGVKSA